MEFWGIEVKPGETVKCKPEHDYYLHISQAALGETKKGSDNTSVYVRLDDKKMVLGTLSADKFPQIQYDLVFEKEFELSHSSKTTSVFFTGYKAFKQDDALNSETDDEDEEEEEKNIPLIKANGKPESKADAAASKPKSLVKDAKKDESDTDDSDEDSDDSDEDKASSDEDDDEMSEDSSEEEDESYDEDEETPKKPETGKKRAAVTVLKTPASDKKAKIATPSGQKRGDKKSIHVATPHPAKQASKTPANSVMSKKSPKSSGSVVCKSCSKTFNSEMALQSHSKAKHDAK